MDAIDASLEEYKSLRQESLEALGRLQTIAQYGLAAAGVGVGIGLVNSKTSVTIASIVLLALMPLLALFGAAMFASEAQRVARAGWYLRGLEARINASIPDGDPLGWETLLANPMHRVRGLVEAVAIVMATTLTISLGLGCFLLADHDYWVGTAIGGATDLVLIVGFVIWARSIWRRLAWYSAAPPGATPPWK
jgi:hypothetical protein